MRNCLLGVKKILIYQSVGFKFLNQVLLCSTISSNSSMSHLAPC